MIDWAAASYSFTPVWWKDLGLDHVLALEDEDRQRQETLLTCMLVCRTWLPRARCAFYRWISVTKRNNVQVQGSLQTNPSLGPIVKELYFNRTQIWHFIELCSLTKLETLRIEKYDLFREHKSLQRVLMSLTTLRCLHLRSIKESGIKELTELLNSLPSLSELFIRLYTLSYDSFDDDRDNAGPPQPNPSFSLRSFNFELKPGISKLLAWLINSETALTDLKDLVVSCSHSEERSCFGGIRDLLHHCGDSLESLTLHSEIVYLDDDTFADLGEFRMRENP